MRCAWECRCDGMDAVGWSAFWACAFSCIVVGCAFSWDGSGFSMGSDVVHEMHSGMHSRWDGIVHGAFCGFSMGCACSGMCMCMGFSCMGWDSGMSMGWDGGMGWDGRDGMGWMCIHVD